jgi:aspartyl-tRNA(Asn)/glutamyl-tRNA(Gln) amidotransferase subunit A
VGVQVAHAEMATPALGVILGAESASVHEERLRESAALFDPLVREDLEANSLYSAMDYIKALPVRTVLREDCGGCFGADAVLLQAGDPGAAAGARWWRQVSAAVPRQARPNRLTWRTSTGLQALVLPCRVYGGHQALPMGLQLWGRPHGEATLFQIGRRLGATIGMTAAAIFGLEWLTRGDSG